MIYDLLLIIYGKDHINNKKGLTNVTPPRGLLFSILSQFSQGPDGTLFPWCAAWRHVRGLDLAGMMARPYGSYAILHHSCNMQHTTCKNI